MAGLLTGASTLVRRNRVVSASLMGTGVVVGLGTVLDFLTAGEREARTEARELWGLSGLATEDGRPLPPPGGWALGPDAIRYVLQWMDLHASQQIVELGPGTSSVLLTRAGSGVRSFYGVEHDRKYLTAVEELLAYHQVSNYRLIHAPLERQSVDGNDVDWYAVAGLDELPRQVDVLIVDGPPNLGGVGSRAPAWPLLRNRMKSGALVLVDDTSRADESEMVGRWLEGGGLRLLLRAPSFVALQVL